MDEEVGDSAARPRQEVRLTCFQVRWGVDRIAWLKATMLENARIELISLALSGRAYWCIPFLFRVGRVAKGMGRFARVWNQL